MVEQARFWFVHAEQGGEHVNLAVAAFTERSARVQARKLLGPGYTISEVDPVLYAHAWVMDLEWRWRRARTESSASVAAGDPESQRVTE
jgi:hypothetical protein